MLRALIVAAVLLLFVALAGPAMLRGAVPFLSLLPPGDLHQFATGFATTGPLQLGSQVLALGWGRLLPGDARTMVRSTALAAVAGLVWEAVDIGVGPILATGPAFAAGRGAGLVGALLGAVGACRLGHRWAKRLARSAAPLASRSP